MPSIIELMNLINSLDEKDKALFDRFFIAQETVGKAVLPDEMKPGVEKSFGSTSSVETQKIVKVLNRQTHEMALFNELRAKRPINTSCDDDVLKIIKDCEGDQFCNPLKQTPSDTFGRIKGRRCITCSNFAKYDAMHAVVIFKKHNPLDFDEKDIRDYCDVSLQWFKKANKSNDKAIYPFLLWNCLWKAASSIIHGHFQLLLGEGIHYAEAEYYNKVRREYYKSFGTDYFKDLCSVHTKLGFGFEHRKLMIFTSITPKKDKEITIIGPELDKRMMGAIFKAANCLVKDFGVNSFNLGVMLPPMDAGKSKKGAADSISADDWKGFPVIARILDRGKLSNRTADIGGMEMFAGSKVIETDPGQVIEKLKKYF